MKITIEDVSPKVLEFNTENDGDWNMLAEIIQRTVDTHVHDRVNDYVDKLNNGAKPLDALLRQIAEPKISAIIDDLISRPIVLTSEYGTPKTEPKPIRDHLFDLFQKAVSERVDGYGRTDSSGKPRLMAMVTKAFDAGMTKELKGMVDQAREEIRSMTRNKIAELIRIAALDVLKETGPLEKK